MFIRIAQPNQVIEAGDLPLLYLLYPIWLVVCLLSKPQLKDLRLMQLDRQG